MVWLQKLHRIRRIREKRASKEVKKSRSQAQTHEPAGSGQARATLVNTATPPRCPCGWAFRHLFLSAFRRLLKHFGSSVHFTGLGGSLISDSSYLCASFHRYPPHLPLIMASRQAAGARPGARFAQFKLVLLGTLFHSLGPLSAVSCGFANMSFMQESLPLERFEIPLALYFISR